jgi:hypothetical protein
VASELGGTKDPVPPLGNYNNNSMDDNLRVDMKPAGNSLLLGAAWKILEASDPGWVGHRDLGLGELSLGELHLGELRLVRAEP